jgi:hypothetical protein
MSEQEKQESQKTVVAFIAGLLIGGLLVWVFNGPTDTNVADETNDEVTEVTQSNGNNQNDDEEDSNDDNASGTIVAELPELPVGDGEVSVADQEASMTVSLAGATFPSDEGWIGVRDFVDGQMTGLLGVVRYSKEQGLVPENITLQRPTVAGNTYAVVFYSENGDRVFNLAEDVQVGGVVDTFVAQ